MADKLDKDKQVALATQLIGDLKQQIQAIQESLAQGKPISAVLVQWLRETCALSYRVNNVISLHEINLDMLVQFVECFYQLSFTQE